MLTTAIGPDNDLVRSVVIDAQGRIVAGGEGGGFALARYNADGSLDTSFSDDGKLTTALGGADSVAIDAQGRIVAAGWSGKEADPYLHDFALARYNADGSLDTTFSDDGKLTTAIGASAGARSVAIDAQGRIVAAGRSIAPNGSDNDFALARYNADGSLDTSFSDDGKLTTAIGSASDIANSVAIDAQGRIVAGGESEEGSNFAFGVTRYNADGSLDTTFSGDGKLTTVIGSAGGSGESVAIDALGRIVAAGTSINSRHYDFALARYNADGSLDTSFSDDGMLVTAIGLARDEDRARSVAIDALGRIVAAGDITMVREDPFFPGSYFTDIEFALARYNPDGSLDTSLSDDGMLTTAIGSHNEARADSVAIDAQGRIVAAGWSNNGSDKDFALARYIGEAPPETTIDWGPSGLTDNRTPSFGFSSNEGGSTFQCRVDGGAFSACTSPHTTAALADGAHAFEVRATDQAGSTDPTPASRSFTVDATPFLPPAPEPTFQQPDRTPPELALAGKKTQKLARTISVRVRATTENLWVSASGSCSFPGAAKVFRLKGTKERFVRRGTSVTLKLEVPTKARTAMKRALRKHKRVRAKLRIKVRDAAGNTRTKTRTIKIKR